MRTVTFSTPEIRKIIDQNFVALNTNIEGDPTAGESIRHRPADPPGPCIRGNGRQNVQIIFMTPALEIFHTVTGFIGPGDLYREMQFAHELYGQIADDSPDRPEIVRNAHRLRLQQTGFRDSEIEASSDIEMMRSMIEGMGNSQTTMSDDSRGNGQADPSALFAPFVRTSVLNDNRFSIRHPLMPLSQLESDPGELVGRGKTFFGSSGFSSNSNRNR